MLRSQRGELKPTNYYGSNCSGTDGQQNRQLTHTSTPKLVLIDNMMAHPTLDYTLSGLTITFLNNIWDSQKITVWS